MASPKQKVYLEGKPLFELPNPESTSQIIKLVSNVTKLSSSEFFLTHNGKIIPNDCKKCNLDKINVNLRILGGKGGFGSMLRAIGAQIEKTTNREACRDLSGRRLRDINEEKRLKAWLDKQKNRDAEAKEKKRKKLEKLMAVPKHEFKDAEYEFQRTELTENVNDAVEEGFKKAAAAAVLADKRKITDQAGGSKPKKAALWMGDDLSSSSDNDSDSDSDSNSISDKKKSIKKNEVSTKNISDEESLKSNSTDESSNSKISEHNSSETSSGGSAIEK